MRVSICIGTYGSSMWAEKADTWALSSALGQKAHEIVLQHADTLANARNQAAEQAQGDWLCFLDADDKLADGYIDAMKAVGEEGLLVPRVRYWRAEGNVWSADEPVFPNRHAPMADMNHCVIGTLVRKAVFDEVGGFREEPIFEDWSLWLRCMRAGERLVYVEDAVYEAFVHTGGRNQQQADALATYQSIRKQHLEANDG